jgi:hypothetical protein
MTLEETTREGTVSSCVVGVVGSHDEAAGLVQGVRSEVMSHVIQRSYHEPKWIALWEETS